MSTQTNANGAAQPSGPATTALRFEVTMLGVADVDRAKAFYERLGWRLDADFTLDDHTRVVQFTPPGSPASIQFGMGITGMVPGSQDDLYLVVDDIEAARAELLSRGADVTEIWHGRGLGPDGHEPGRDPDRTSYGTFASFTDPDGNRWLLQEITQRLPGRVSTADIADLAALLHETSMRHGAFEAIAPPHDWSDWYAAYMNARQTGSGPDAAATTADQYMADVKHIVPAGRS
jgi:catechol 2,3-dioxygenase-like lactoylglutathione lyase family enzyme